MHPVKNGGITELTQVLKTLNKTASYLKVKLSRRFSILGAANGFQVHINGTEITEIDRAIYENVQFLWAFDQDFLNRVSSLSKNIAKIKNSNSETSCTQIVSNIVNFADGGRAQVSGYIASVFKPKDLGSREDSANTLSIFANGRVFAENILTEANSAKYYQNYLVGEIHANFLDEDEIDRATASREAIKRDDPRYRALIGFALSTLEAIGDQWDEWRVSLGPDPTDGSNKGVMAWLGTIKDQRDQLVAKRLMTSIQNATIHSDENKNSQAKAVLYRGAIIGFEKLLLKNQLNRLTTITDVLGPEFAAIFSGLSDVEEAAYADITKQRLEIIKKFRDIKDSPTELEKVAQNYLFNHLWLLDPTWDRVSGRATMELTLTEHIKKVNPDSTGARLDISYRASSGRHIVIELKKPSLTNLKFDDLSNQARKYRQAVERYYQEKLPNSPIPPLDIYLLIGKMPIGIDDTDKKAMAAQSAKIITYQELITNSTNSYQSYLDVSDKTGSLENILQQIK